MFWVTLEVTHFFQGEEMRRVVFVFLICLLSISGLAGNGWIGSGGDLLGDTKNPWWVQNKKTIRYCIKVDQQSISAKESDIDLVVEKSFQNWLVELKYFFKNEDSLFKLGDQALIKQDCQGDQEGQDITFYFGWNSLDPEKKEKIRQLKDYKSIVGLTVRTHYDTENLTGKGFIFIGSDRGSDKFKSHEPLYPQPWRHPFLLSMVLAHEIAHVFGFQHSEQFDFLMREDFFELFLNNDIVNIAFKNVLSKYFDFKYFSRFREYRFDISETDPDIKGFFGSMDSNQLKMVPKDSEMFKFDVYEELPFGQSRLTHRLEFNSGISTYGANSSTISLYLPPEQTVITRNPKDSNRIYAFTDFTSEREGFIEFLATGEKKPIYLTASRESVRFLHYNGDRHLNIPFRSDLFKIQRQRHSLLEKPK